MEWGKAFPVRHLVKQGCFQRPESDVDAVSKLLVFFGVGSVDAWIERYGPGKCGLSTFPKLQEQRGLHWLHGCGLVRLKPYARIVREYNETRFKRAPPLPKTAPQRCSLVALAKEGRYSAKCATQVRRPPLVRLLP